MLLERLLVFNLVKHLLPLLCSVVDISGLRILTKLCRMYLLVIDAVGF